MIALDTNVLLRYLLDDDPVQTSKAYELINGNESVLLTDVVLAEAIWTLKGKKYRLGRSDLITVIQALFKEPNIRFENAQAVWQALHDFRKAKSVGGRIADFPDALIVNKAKAVSRGLNTKLKAVYTFDKAAQQIPGTEAP